MTTTISTMRGIQVARPGADFALVERPIPEPGRGHVRVRVQACGVCYSDSLTKEGAFPHMHHPLVPGHEIVGIVDTLGEDALPWQIGDRVGLGWFGGHCGHCAFCRRGDFLNCTSLAIPGITFDGGYAEYVVAQADALARVPEALTSQEAAPLMCAGVTTFNGLRHSEARSGDLVAVLGLGGLGHLGVQFAAKMGFETVAIARGADKEPFARELGAAHYIDSATQDVAAQLQALGGARVILATVPSADAMTSAYGGLAPHGTLLIAGASTEPLGISPLAVLVGNRRIQGWSSGIAMDSQDTLEFAAKSGVRPMIETYPLERAADAYERMISGKARFRVVLETGA
ncbi:MAG TPA: alcohol dehydrogenase [Candidatus Acidoferrum sp.]|nr:alcohol dehydrogenase [Candidatus Acidoferrum sp.]